MDGNSILGKFFGQRGPEIPQIQLDPSLIPEPPKQEKKNDIPDGVGVKFSNFDPTGLERAAAAAKELDRSSKFVYIITITTKDSLFIPQYQSCQSKSTFNKYH